MTFKEKFRKAALKTAAAVDKHRMLALEVARSAATLTSGSTPLAKVAVIASMAADINHKFLAKLYTGGEHSRPFHFGGYSATTEALVFLLESHKIVKKLSHSTVLGGSNYGFCDYYAGTVDGMDIVCSLDSKGTSSRGALLYVPNGVTDDQANAKLADQMWKLQKHAIVVTSEMTPRPYIDTVCADYVVSKEAETLMAYVEKAVSVKIPRSILLWGPPGSGKTELANYITTKAFKRRLYITPYVTEEQLAGLLATLAPECVVLNDFAITNDLHELLPTLELLRRHVPLTLLTANSTAELPSALLRPGRIDEIIQLDKLHGPAHELLVRKILGDTFGEELFATVSDWPMAFIQELRARVDLGRSLQDAIQDLSIRLENNDNNNDVSSYGPKKSLRKGFRVPQG